VTDGRTNITCYRDAKTHLKRGKRECAGVNLNFKPGRRAEGTRRKRLKEASELDRNGNGSKSQKGDGEDDGGTARGGEHGPFAVGSDVAFILFFALRRDDPEDFGGRKDFARRNRDR